MKKHRILVSADGMTACPSCNQHMTLDVSALEDVACPFCGAGLTATLREGGKGSGVIDALRSSRSGLVAAMLGASLTMACSGDDNNDNHTNHDNHNKAGDMASSDDMAVEEADMHFAGNDYGGGGFENFGTEPNIGNEEDMGSDSADMTSEEDMGGDSTDM